MVASSCRSHAHNPGGGCDSAPVYVCSKPGQRSRMTRRSRVRGRRWGPVQPGATPAVHDRPGLRGPGHRQGSGYLECARWDAGTDSVSRSVGGRGNETFANLASGHVDRAHDAAGTTQAATFVYVSNAEDATSDLYLLPDGDLVPGARGIGNR
jgi:hypothetical protein